MKNLVSVVGVVGAVLITGALVAWGCLLMFAIGRYFADLLTYL